jgi:hypothetical protein
VIVCAAHLDAKSAYVAFSRAREQATGYTPDKATLFDTLPETNRPRQAALDLWTPARTRRLVWARQVIARIREIFTTFVPETKLVVELPLVPVRPVRIESVAERTDVSPSRRCQRPSAQSDARTAMRVRF